MASNYKKLLELSLYISQKAGGDGYLGKTKLNKLLFLADFHYYLKTGKSITGQTYLRFPKGPVPKDMKKVEASTNDIAFQAVKFFNKDQQKPVALREPQLEEFAADEIDFVSELIDVVCSKNNVSASWLSDDSHEYIGWLLFPNGAEIPYNTIYLGKKDYQKATEFDKVYAQKLRTTLGENYGYGQKAL